MLSSVFVAVIMLSEKHFGSYLCLYSLSRGRVQTRGRVRIEAYPNFWINVYFTFSFGVNRKFNMFYPYSLTTIMRLSSHKIAHVFHSFSCLDARKLRERRKISVLLFSLLYVHCTLFSVRIILIPVAVLPYIQACSES